MRGALRRWVSVPLVLAAIAGCALQASCVSTPATAVAGAAQAQSVAVEDARLAQAYAGLATARSTAARLLVAGRISIEDAERVQDAADGIRASLDLALSALAAGGARGTYEQTLASAQTLLAGLEVMLRGRGGATSPATEGVK